MFSARQRGHLVAINWMTCKAWKINEIAQKTREMTLVITSLMGNKNDWRHPFSQPTRKTRCTMFEKGNSKLIKMSLPWPSDAKDSIGIAP